MFQQGQVLELTTRSSNGRRLWAYRYRTGGRSSKRVQRGGFACEQVAREALGRAHERLRREQRLSRSLALAELVEDCLGQHDAEPVTSRRRRRRRPLRSPRSVSG